MVRTMRSDPANVQRAVNIRPICVASSEIRCEENPKDWRRNAQQGGIRKGAFSFPYFQKLDFKNVISNGEIVSSVLEQGLIEKALRVYNVHSSHRDDLTQEVLLILLTMDNERLNDIYTTGKIPHFVTKIVKNQWCSVTSTYYSTFRKYEQKKTTKDYHGTAERCDDEH